MSFSQLGPFPSTMGEHFTHHSNPKPSMIMENNLLLTSNTNIGGIGRQGALQSSRTIVVKEKIIFIRMQADLKMYGGDELFELLNQRYQQRLFFRYFDGYSPVLEIKFALEPVCILITTYQTRSWARRFAMNQREHLNFRIFMVCNSEAEMVDVVSWEMPNIVNIFAGNWVDYMNKQVAIEYQHYGHDYIIGTDQARKQTKYFYRYNNNQVLNIYYSAKLEPMLNKVGKQFLKSPRFKNTRLKSFTTIEQLLGKFNDRRRVRKSTVSGMTKVSKIGNTTNFLDKIQQKLKIETENQKQKNLILIDSGHPQYEQIRVMVQEDKKDRWQMIVFGATNDWQRHVPNIPVPEQNMVLMPEWERQQIVSAEELIVIIYIDDTQTAYEFQQLQNINFHSNLLKFDTPQTLETILRQLSDNPKDFGLLILYQDRYEEYSNSINRYLYQNSDNQVSNIKILLKARDIGGGSLSIASFPGEGGSSSYLNQKSLIGLPGNEASLVISPEDILGEESPNILEQIFTYRNLFYHPAKGLMGRKVELLINKNRQYLIGLCENICSHNRRRLTIQTWNDFQHLNYLVRRVKPNDNAIVVTNTEELPFVMREIGGIFGVHAVLVTDIKLPKVPAQVLKQGNPRQIQQFLMLIDKPIEDFNWISEKTYTDIIAMPESGIVGMAPQRSMQRLGLQDELVVPNTITNKKKIVVRIPDNLDPDNVAVLETKLFHHYGDQIQFKYYANTEQIRDMDKWEQPLQFLIVTDEPSLLNWMKIFAMAEANQRFEIIVYTGSPNLNHLAHLTQDQRLRRFKLVSNSWAQIQQYIIGRDYRSINMSLYPNQKLRVVLSQRDKFIQQQLVSDAVTLNHPIAQRCVFQFYDDMNPQTLVAAMQRIPISMNQPVIVIVNESRQTAINEQLAANLLVNNSTFVKVLVIYPNTSSRLYHLPRTAGLVVNQLEAVRWIENIRFMGSINLLPPPVILVERTNQYWRNYLNRMSKRINFREFTDEEELRFLINQILSVPNQTIWILLNSRQEYEYYRRVGLSAGKNVGYIVQSHHFKAPFQTQDLIFGSNDSDEIEMFLLNYQKKSVFLLSPSHLKPSRVTLIFNRSIPVDQVEMARWSRFPGATIKYYDQEVTLRKYLEEDRQSNIFVFYTHSEDQMFGDAIAMKYDKVRRVVYNPEFKGRPYFQHSSVAFVGESSADINQFLTTLRYLIRNPPFLIKKDYVYPLTNVFVPFKYFDQLFLSGLIMDNQSIIVYFYNNPQQLISKYDKVHLNCNNLIIGNSGIQSFVRSQPLFNTAKFINNQVSNNNISGNTILSTEQHDEILLYLRNIPVTRYNHLSSIKGVTGVYYDPNSFRKIAHQIDDLPKYNPGINVYKYTDVRQIEKNLIQSKEGYIFILVNAVGDYQNKLEYLQSIASKIPNKKIKILILSNDPNIMLSDYRTIIDREDVLMRYLNHIPIASEETIFIDERRDNAPVKVTKQDIMEDVTLVFGKRKPAGFINGGYLKADQPPVVGMTQSSRVARSWVQPQSLNKFTILKSINPAVNINLVQQIVSILTSQQIRTSRPSVSRVSELRTIPKPAYQIKHKNRAASLILQQDIFMQRSPRVEISAGAIMRDQPMKILNKPLIPTIRRVTVTHTPSPPKVVVVPHVVVPQVVTSTSTVTTKIVSHRVHPCKVALFFSDTPESQRNADFIIRSTDEDDRSIIAIPFNNIVQVGQRLQREYNMYDEIIIILDPQYASESNIAEQITQKFRRARWFVIDQNNPDSLTKISLVFNLGWNWKELQYPYKNQNFVLEQYNNIRFILPQGFYRNNSQAIGPGVETYSTVHQILPIIERGFNHHTLNVVIIPYSMLSVVYRLPFKYQNLRFIVIDDSDSGISERLQFDNYGEIFWAYANRNPLEIQQYLSSLINRRTLLSDTLSRNVLFYQVSEQKVAFSLSFIGYFKTFYMDLRDLEQKMQNLRPNETAFVLKLIDGRWIPEKQNKVMKKVSKINIPRAGGVSKVLSRPRYRPWILPSGQFIEDTDEEGKRKKILLVKMFSIDIFSKFNDFRFYYLANSEYSITPGKDIHPRTAEMISIEVVQNPQALFVVFLDKGEERQLNQQALLNPRINLIRISDEHYQNQLHIRADQCQSVIQRIRNIERNSQIRYVLYRGHSNNSELKLQQLLLQQRNIEQVEYNSMKQFELEVERLQGKYRQMDVIVFDEQLMQSKRILDLFKINPYKLISIRRDARDRDSERNSDHQLKIDSKLGAKPSYQRKNSLGLLEAVQQLGNLQNIVLLVDGNSNQKDRIVRILGKQLVSRITMFNTQPIMRSLTDQFISKPVLILSDNQGISDFTQGRNGVLYIECNPNSNRDGFRNTFVLQDWEDLEGLARVLRQYVPTDYPINQQIESAVDQSNLSQQYHARSNVAIIADRLTPDLNGHPIAIYLPRDRMISWKADIVTRQNIMILAYTDQNQIQKYIKRYDKNLSLILLPPGAAQLARDLQNYPLTRIMTQPGDYQGMDYIQINSSVQLDDLIDKLSRRNELKDRQRIQMTLHQLSKTQSEQNKYSMTLNLRNQKQKNLSVKSNVLESNSSHVIFQVYKGVKDLQNQLKSLGDNIGIIVENDHEIEDIERLVTANRYLKLHLIRHYSNPLLASKDNIPGHDKVIFTCISNKQISKDLNSLIYRSFKNYDKLKESKVKKMGDNSGGFSSSGSMRGRSPVTTFGTTGRFDGDEQRSYSRQNSNKILTRALSPGGTRLQ